MKTIVIGGARYSVMLDAADQPKDAITGKEYAFCSDKQTDILSIGNKINRYLLACKYRLPVYADCDIEEADSGIIRTGWVVVNVYILSYMKDNRQTRRGNGQINRELLNYVISYEPEDK